MTDLIKHPKKLIRYCFLLCLLNVSFSMMGQSIFQRHFTTKDGLPSNQIFDIEEDDKGRLWLASDNGICYFDGVNFTPIATDPKIDDTIFWLYKNDDLIWCISLDGQLQYIKDGKIYTYQGNNLIINYKKHRICSGFYVDNHNIYFSHYSDGLKMIDSSMNLKSIRSSVYQEGDSTFKYTLQLNEQLIPYSTYPKLEYNTSNIFDINTFYLEDTTFSFKFPGVHSHKSIQRSIKTGENRWLCTNEKCLFELSNKGVKMIELFDHRINAIHVARDGSIWIGFIEGGIRIYQPGKLATSDYVHLLSPLSVCSIHEDGNGNIWCSTLEKGVYCSINPDAVLIKNKGNVLFQDLIEHNKDFYAVSSNGELTRISNNTLKHYPSPNPNQVYYWIDNNEDNVYIGGQSIEKKYLITTNPFSSKEIAWGSNEQIVAEKLEPITLLETNDSVLLKLYGGDKFWLSYDQLESFREPSYFLGRTDCLFSEGKNSFWRSNGTQLLRFENGKYKRANFSSEIRILDIKRLSEDQLLLATKQKGLCIYYTGLDSLTTIYNDPLDKIVSIAYMDSNIWACSNDKVIQLNINNLSPFDYTISKFDQFDGITNENLRKILVDEEYILLLTDLGINKIKKDQLQNKISRPTIFFTNILSNSKPITDTGKISIPFSKNQLVFSFNSVDLIRKKNIEYFYQLEGFHDEIQITRNNSIEFSSLPPGKYNLTLYAFNGRFKSETLEYSFVIESPIWTSWYWILLLIILIVAIFSTIIRTIISVKLKRKLKNEENEREKLKLKLKALKAQMNPHFMFNSLNSIQYYILENDSQSAAKYLSKFSSLIRLILEESEVDYGKLSNELKMIQLYLELEQLRLENKFDFEISIDKKINPFNIAIPSLLVQPIIENSVWHGMTNKKEKGKIHVDFRLSDKHLICTVTDNGIGRNKAREFKQNNQFRKSMGMSISRERLNLLHTKLQNDIIIQIKDLEENGIPSGTEVTLKIPLIPFDSIKE